MSEQGPRPDPRPEPTSDDAEAAQLLSRRAMLGLIGGAGAYLAAEKVVPKVLQNFGAESAGAATDNLTAEQITARDIEQEHRELAPTFADPEAEAIARDLGMEPTRYFRLTSETMDAINTKNAWLTQDTLMPIYDSGVLDHAKVLEAAAKEFDVPANYLGLICMIESRGVVDAKSHTEARGIMQIQASFHLDKFVKLGYMPPTATYKDYQAAFGGGKSYHTMGEYLKVMNDPEASARVGAMFFAELLAKTRRENPSLSPDHPEVFARAGAGYNGGPDRVHDNFEDLKPESKKYFNDVEMFLIDAETAARLRAKGKTDQEIATAMHSPEVDALAKAYVHIPKDPYVYETYKSAFEQVSRIPDLPPGSPERVWYERYKSGEVPAYHPATPARRVRSAAGEKA